MKSKLFKILSFLGVLAFSLTAVMPAMAAPAFAPSTPDDNKAKGWAYHEVVEEAGGVWLTLYAPRNLWSCVEYRADDEAPLVFPHTYLFLSPLLADGRFRDLCGHGTSSPVQTIFIPANSHVDIRMSYGGEGDERYYEWYRYYVLKSSDGSTTVHSSPSPDVCNMSTVSAPNWIPYGDANVELRWDSNGCDVHIRSLDGGPWIKLAFASKSYSTEDGWVGVLARLPVGENGVSPGWSELTMGTNRVRVWVGHTPPPEPTSWFYLPALQVLQRS